MRKSNHIIEDKSIDLACMLQSKIMGLNTAIPFLVPVDALKLGIPDYYNIVKTPMDLGTVHDNLMKHKYQKLCDANTDIGLVFSNAMLYNPPMHPIHMTALKLQKLYDMELARLCEKWQHELVGGRRVEAGELLVDFSDVSLQRNVMSVEIPTKKRKAPGANGAKGGSASAAPSRATSPVPDAVIGAVVEAQAAAAAEIAGINSQPAGGMGGTNDKLAAMAAAQLKNQEKMIERQERETTENNITALLGESNGAMTVAQLMMGPDYAASDPMKKGKKNGGNDPKTKGGAPFLALTVPNAVSLTTKSDKSRRSWLGVEVGKSLRKMRTEFFVVMLQPEDGLEDEDAIKLQDDKVIVWEGYVGKKYRNLMGKGEGGKDKWLKDELTLRR